MVKMQNYLKYKNQSLANDNIYIVLNSNKLA